MKRPEASAGALHNMSAPPRMQLTLRPLAMRNADGTPAKRPLSGYHGLQPRFLLDWTRLGERGYGLRETDALYRRALHSSPGAPLALLAALAESELSGGSLPIRPPGLPADLSLEQCEDRLQAVCARIDPAAFGLPPIGYAAPIGNINLSAEFVVDPLLFVAVLCRISGSVFMATRQPHVPGVETLKTPLALYGFQTPAEGFN